MKSTDSIDQRNDSDIKVFAVLGYLVPILFFIPLLNVKMKNIPSVRFHANQQILLLIGYLCLATLKNATFLGFTNLSHLSFQLVNATLFVLGIYGAYQAFKDKLKELPLIGNIKIL